MVESEKEVRPADHQYGCNTWCVELRGRLADRADTAERAIRAKDQTIHALRAEISRLKEPPEEPTPAQKYADFEWRAWMLLGFIIMVIGAGLVGVEYLIDKLSDNTTFVG